MTVTSFVVPDLHCGACAERIDRTLAALPAVDGSRINTARRRVFVEHDEATMRAADAPPGRFNVRSANGWSASRSNRIPSRISHCTVAGPSITIRSTSAGSDALCPPRIVSS